MLRPMYIYDISCSILLRMTNVSDKNQNTHIIYTFLNRAVYEIKWKNMVDPDRPQMTI